MRPEAAAVFAGIGVLMIIITHLTIQRRLQIDPAFASSATRQRHAKLHLYPNGIVMIALGVYSLLGAPIAIVLLTLWPSLIVSLWPMHAAARLG